MKTKIFIIGIQLFAMSLVALAQKPSLKQYIMDASKHLQLKEYNQAIEKLTWCYNQDSTNGNVCFLLGKAYFYSDQTLKKCISYLSKAKPISKTYNEANPKERNAPFEALFLLSNAYYHNYMFENALPTIEEYLTYNPTNKEEAEQLKKYIQNAIELVNNPLKINIINLGCDINSTYDDHSPVFSLDEKTMIFTSKRKGSTGNFKTSDGQYFEDIYITHKVDDKWQSPQKISENINTMEHEASVALNADGSELIIYKDDVGDGNLYISMFNGTDWTKPTPLSSNVNSTYDESHASISADGNTLYFSSNRPGGNGGYDIYTSKRLPNGEWSLATNVGPVINTDKDENGPFIHPDGTTLYFSSKGHNSMGGYDLFYSVLKEDGTFSKPDNMGYPINSIDNDAFYVISADGKRAYYATNQTGGCGGRDIYMVDLLSVPERSIVLVTGYLRKAGTNDIVKDVVLTITDVDNNIVGEFKPNHHSGKYTLVLPKSKQHYQLKTSDNSIQFDNDKLEIPDNSSFYMLQRPVELEVIGTVK